MFVTASAVNQAVSQGIIPSPQTFTGAAACTCDFLTFGYWQTSISEDSRHHHHHHEHQIASVAQAPWVTGQLAVQLPNAQIATYTGAIYGTLQNGQNIGGSFQDTFCFACRSGTATASIYGQTLNGSIGSTSSNGVGIAGTLSNTGGWTGSFAGSFYGSAGSVPAGQAGKISINGPTGSNVAIGGIFATGLSSVH